MIAKKIRNPRKSASKYVRTQRLVDYIRNPKNKEEKEKNVYDGARNFFEENKKAQVQEMQDLAHAAARSKDPINHYVISWKSGEKPTPEQIERTVDVVLDELKMKDHKVIYALHADTKHYHLHLVANRVHPETEKVVLPNRGFDLELLHRAVARLEHEQGWEKEERARYQVHENGELRRNKYEEREKQPSQEKRDQEERTGAKSAERIAQEKAPAVLRAASSWKELHGGLAKEGMGFEKKGTGAVLRVGKVPVKASSVGREYSLGNLQKRLGAFELAHKHIEVQLRPPEPFAPKSSDWRRYLSEKARYEETKKNAVVSLREKHLQEKRAFAFHKQEKQVQLFSQDWRGRGKELNQERSRLAVENKAALSQLKATQTLETKGLKQKHPPFPSLEAWLAKQRQLEPEVQPTHQGPELHKQAAQQEQTKQQKEHEQIREQPVRRYEPDIER
jgi:hypothetical protein